MSPSKDWATAARALRALLFLSLACGMAVLYVAAWRAVLDGRLWWAAADVVGLLGYLQVARMANNE